jgi:hypothetical protein
MACIWDAANKSTSITLYRAATCAASIVSNGTWKGARATVSQSTGKFYLEVIPGYLANNGFLIGFGNSSFNTANYVGSDGNSFGYQAGGFTQGISGGWQTMTKMGEVVQIAIDLDAKLVWARTDRSTNWNNSGSANPATGTGGKTYTTTGALFPAISLLGSSATNTNWGVLNAGAFTFSGSIPSGFSAWDTGSPSGTGIGGTFGPTTWNAATKNANVTLTSPNLQASQASLNNLWGAVYSTSNYNSGFTYFEMTMLAYDNNNGFIFGVSDTTAGSANNTYVGIGSFAVGYQAGLNLIYTQSASNTGEPTWQGGLVPNTFGCAVDFNRGLMWVKNLNADPGLWNNDAAGDPVAGTRGAAIPPGDLYIAWSGVSSGAADTVLLNVGLSPFVGTAPSGYSAWDATGGGSGATAQADSFLREVLLADTGTVSVDSINRQVLLTDTGVLHTNGLLTEVLLTNPSSLQVGGVFAEVLRSTTIWTPLPMRKSKTYRIR